MSTSGGTDLNGSFVGGVPWLPVHAGELQVNTDLTKPIELCLSLGYALIEP